MFLIKWKGINVLVQENTSIESAMCKKVDKKKIKKPIPPPKPLMHPIFDN